MEGGVMGNRRPGHGLRNVILDESLTFPHLLEIICFISKCLRKIKQVIHAKVL